MLLVLYVMHSLGFLGMKTHFLFTQVIHFIDNSQRDYLASLKAEIQPP